MADSTRRYDFPNIIYRDDMTEKVRYITSKDKDKPLTHEEKASIRRQLELNSFPREIVFVSYEKFMKDK